MLRAGSWGSSGELSTFTPSRSLLHSLQPRPAAEGTKSPSTQGQFSSQFLCHRGRVTPKNSPARQEGSILMLHLPLSALYLPQTKSLSPAQPGQGDISSAVPVLFPTLIPCWVHFLFPPFIFQLLSCVLLPAWMSPPSTGPCPCVTPQGVIPTWNCFPPPLASALFCPHPCTLPASHESPKKRHQAH